MAKEQRRSKVSKNSSETEPPVPVPSWLETQVDDWLTAAQARGRVRSEQTLIAYRKDMKIWAGLLADGRPVTPDMFTPEAIERCLVEFANAGLAVATRRRRLATMRGFTRWAAKRGRIPEDPCDDLYLSMPAAPRALPVAFSDGELAAIHTAICVPPKAAWSRWTELDRAMFAVLIGAGLRASEVCGLQIGDIHEDPPAVINVVGKGHKQRRVPIDDDTLKVLKSWLWVRTRRNPQNATAGTTHGDPLFINRQGKPITTNALHGRVLSWLKQAGVPQPKGAAAHAFRHTYAHRMAINGVPVPVIQAALGHTSIATTSIYVRANAVDIANAINASHPGQTLTGRALNGN